MTELDKWALAQPTLHVAREFLEWLDAQQLQIASWKPSGYSMLPISEDRERMLARFVEVDLVKLENERRALLAKIAP